MTQKTVRVEFIHEKFKNKKCEEKVNLPGELHFPGILLVSTAPALADMFTCSGNMKFVTFCMDPETQMSQNGIWYYPAATKGGGGGVESGINR
jgi:hypothetical protein